jgi:tRNA threonylcarbamoyladenosine biosynthesis protein TsaB
MNWIFGIDTASAELSVGLMCDDEPVISCSRYVRNAHAEHITRAVTFVLESGGISAEDISHAGIAVGPGSFTGLRIGISFLKGFFLTRDTPILPVSSLASIAEACHHTSELLIPVMDARRGNLFCAKFRRENGALVRMTDDTIMTIQSFSIFYKKHDTIVIDTLGYTKSSLYSVLKEWGAVRLVTDTPLQRGLACAHIARQSIHDRSVWKQSTDILPNYMQATYAETKKKKQLLGNQYKKT